MLTPPAQIDNMWLLLSNSTSSFNPVCTATYTFKQPPSMDGMRAALGKQVELFPKYKQRLANVGRRWHGASFVDDPHYSVDRHLFEEDLPGEAGKRELEDFVRRAGCKVEVRR
jgi:hypothetical protein